MKRILSIILALAMLLSMVSIAAIAEEEPIVIKAVTNKHAGGIPDNREDDFVYQAILEKFNIKLELDDLQEYDTALMNLINGGDVPDLMFLTPDMMQQYAEAGYIRSINEIKDCDTWQIILDRWGETVDIPSMYYDGDLYAIPMLNPQGDFYYEIYTREDWNEKYNLKNPTTIDELYDYCCWMRDNDPDGNGIADTIGFTCWGLTGMCAITSPYDVAFGNYLLVRDGKVTNTVLQPGMKDALATVKKFWDAGLIDAGWASNSESKATTFACNVGVVAMPWSNLAKAAYTEQYKAVNPEASYAPIEAFSVEEGGEKRYSLAKYDQNVGEKMCVGCNVDDAKLEAIFTILEYFSQDGYWLPQLGVEGRHWEYDANGTPVMSTVTEIKAEVNYIHEYQWLGRDEMTYLAAKFPEASKEVAWGLHYNILEYFNTSVIVPDDFNLADMESYINTQLIAFYKGERDLAEYDQFIQELYDSYDFGEYMNLATEQLVALGLANE